VIRHSRYKYFSNSEYAKQFQNGRIYHRTLVFFRDYEDVAANSNSSASSQRA
jgi:hypothetical protein